MNTNIARLKSEIDKGASLPHQAVKIAMHLFELRNKAEISSEEVTKLTVYFLAKLKSWGLGNLLDIQLFYARDLATSPGLLEYEEMHKLFSLCDEIRVLIALGLSAEKKLLIDLERALLSRFLEEPKKAHLVAQDRVDDWNRKSWWYSTNLKHKIQNCDDS